MAQELDSYEFRSAGRAATQKYPWDEWANGSIWRLSHGEDFQTKAEAVGSAAREYASTHDKMVIVSLREAAEDGTGDVVLQFRDKTDEDRQRLEELAAKRAQRKAEKQALDAAQADMNGEGNSESVPEPDAETADSF